MSVQVTNAGPDADTLHVLPTAWFRNTWSWDVDSPRPGLEATGRDSVAVHHPFLGELELLAAPGPDGAPPEALFCENETNTARLYGVGAGTPYPKDGINDHVRVGRAHGQPGPARDQVRLLVPADRAGGRDRRAAAAAAPDRLRRGTGRRRWGRRSTRSSPVVGPRPTSSTPS